jgi:hypothetical protein
VRRFLIYPLIVVAAVAVEALFRWSNGLDLTWSWLGYRTAVLTCIVGVSAWSSRRDAKRSDAGRAADDDIWTSIVLLLFGGAGFVFWTWRGIDALLTGRVIVSTVPDTYTIWSANPTGFAVAMGLGMLADAFFLLLFVGGIVLGWQYFSRRRRSARP